MKDNPISREIINSVYNSFADYFPRLMADRSEDGLRFSVGVRLPKSHRDLIPYINGNSRFRAKVKENIESILLTHEFKSQSYLEINFSSASTSFNTDGNACGIYIYDGDYTYHNIDTYEQASILFIALSTYLATLYPILENLRNKSKSELEKMKKLESFVAFKIQLMKIEGCKKKFEECIHSKTWICSYCIRNWNKMSALREESELARLGDKFESPKGPKKYLCISCGANMKDYICHYCGLDNSDFSPELKSKLKVVDNEQTKISDFF